MSVVIPTETPMIRAAHDQFERVIAEHYESLKPEVLATVRGKLAVANLHPDASDLEAAYNAAWHALYEQSRRDDMEIGNLGGWLATITYRRAIDDVRRSRVKYRAPVAVGDNVSGVGYEPDVDDEIDDRRRYHQWLMSLRLRLTARERQAVGLCVLHEYSRKDASEVMGVDIKRLDKIMVAANKKLGGALDAINRGAWCEEQRSLIKAYAFGLHEQGGERHALAAAHVSECLACARYVRSLRGLSAVVPPPALLAGAAGAGGGILGGLFGGGAGGGAMVGGSAAGGGGATLLGGIGAKSAALCASAVCAAGGAAVVLKSAPQVAPPSPSVAAPRATAPAAVEAPRARTTTVGSSARKTTSGAEKRRTRDRRTPPDPGSKGAQEIAELGIEPQATSPSPADGAQEALVPRAASASEFGIGP